MTSEQTSSNTALRLGSLAVLGGLLLGGLTMLGQQLLPDVLQPAANSISPWLTVAFAIGAPTTRPAIAAVAGFVALAFALIGYYSAIRLIYGYWVGPSALLLWGVAAVAGGMVFGPAGWFWRNDHGWRRAIGVGLLSAVYIAEAVYLYLILQPEAKPAAILFGLVGLAVPVALGRTGEERLRMYAAVVPGLLLGVAGYVFILALADIAAGL